MSGLDAATLLAVWEQGRHEAPPNRALTLLALAGPDRAQASRWDVGSRDALLASLLEGLTGATAWGCADCCGCGAELDVPVDVGLLARTPVRAPAELLYTTVDGVTVGFRLPNTEDLRDLGMDPVAARSKLLARCTGRNAREVSAELAAAVETAMEEASPTGAVQFSVECPACRTATETALDVAVLLWAEVELRALVLLREVHVLAIAYGWTEVDVLALSPLRRAAYLEMARS